MGGVVGGVPFVLISSSQGAQGLTDIVKMGPIEIEAARLCFKKNGGRIQLYTRDISGSAIELLCIIVSTFNFIAFFNI